MMFENAQTFFFPLLGFSSQCIFAILMVVIVRIPCISSILKNEKLRNVIDETQDKVYLEN